MPAIGTHFEAPPALADVVKHFYCVRTSADFDSTMQHLSPGLEIMLLFNFGPPLPVSFGSEPLQESEVQQVGIVGPLRKMLHYKVLPETDLIAVTFNPAGFYRIFNVRADQMEPEKIDDPDKMLNITGFAKLWHLLKKMPATEDRVKLLTEYGSTFVQAAEAESIPLLAGLEKQENGFTEPSRAIALDARLSERIVQMRFKRYLGFSAKELTRLLRFKKVIDFLQQQQQEEVDWMAIVTRFGYYDQSHLIKDFRYYLAISPKKFVRQLLGKTFCVSRPAAFVRKKEDEK